MRKPESRNKQDITHISLTLNKAGISPLRKEIFLMMPKKVTSPFKTVYELNKIRVGKFNISKGIKLLSFDFFVYKFEGKINTLPLFYFKMITLTSN